MKVLSDGTKVVYKRIPSEVFEMVEMMKKKNLPNLSRKIDNLLTHYDYIVITYNGCYYDVQKYNGLGNLIKFTVITFSNDYTVNYYETSHIHPIRFTMKPHRSYHHSVELDSFDNEKSYLKTEMDNFGDLKFRVKMSKHNLDLSQIPS